MAETTNTDRAPERSCHVGIGHDVRNPGLRNVGRKCHVASGGRVSRSRGRASNIM
ncbi:hypothetical protein H6P81_009761 [Aristolochia fimbriata]|uniref:Uncharacterized protein n=1 Tax=Aristolochia fimbriata TaxID=158543 RepID=A0AAV7EMX0_ARIFI|nr:hypothetical protein H6P81_009761 [Aristolochia fimbriata]